jgi:hypothetical protein
VNVPRLDDTQRAALANWWDLAQYAANHGFTSTDLISAASDIANQAGRSLSFDESSAIATLYGYSRRIFNASGELQAAGPGAWIGSEMISVPPWARDEQVMNTTPVWHVTFEFTYVDQAGNVVTEHRTSVQEMALSGTIDQLQSDTEADAQAMADKYGVQFVSANSISILAV